MFFKRILCKKNLSENVSFFEQVSFLHVYHHFSIAWAWYLAMNLFPGGDAYFGALLNSFIHVLMYSYYALSLLKILCPWKKYLTQAQLLQFASVMVYSVFSYLGWPEDERNWRHVSAVATQVWEMASLFALFSFFYAKSYGKKANKATIEDDACQVAVKKAVSGAAGVVEHAAKDAEKIARSIQKNLS